MVALEPATQSNTIILPKFLIARHEVVTHMSLFKHSTPERSGTWQRTGITGKGISHTSHKCDCHSDVERTQSPNIEKCGEPAGRACNDVEVNEVAGERHAERRHRAVEDAS